MLFTSLILFLIRCLVFDDKKVLFEWYYEHMVPNVCLRPLISRSVSTFRFKRNNESEEKKSELEETEERAKLESQNALKVESMNLGKKAIFL